MQDLTNEQLIFLDNLIYLNLHEVGVKDETLTLAQVISLVLKTDENGTYENLDKCIKYNEDKTVALIPKEGWINLLESFVNNPKNSNLSNFLWHNTNCR